jgi:hypothetical protein
VKIKDKERKQLVDVCCKDCPTYKCYWPRLNPGSFVQGQGYHHFGDVRDKEWICGTRAIRGCPDHPKTSSAEVPRA